VNILDDHSRLLVASVAFSATKGTDVVATFQAASAKRKQSPPRQLTRASGAGLQRAATLHTGGAFLCAAYLSA
jgi:hypothetical protein